MPQTDLSPDAVDLLRRRMNRERVEVTEETRPAYRELVAAGLMYPVHTLAGGNEGYYRPTDAACDLRDAGRLNSPASPISWPEAALSRDG